MATQFALGGIPRTLIDLAVSNSPVGQFVAENMQTYLRGPLSSAYAEGVFGATGSEVDAVRPASDLSADFTIGLAGTALPFVGKAGVDKLVNAATRAAGVFRSAKARLEAKVREQYTLLRS